jgi:tRNA(Ile)-lysidine synthase
VRLVHAGAEIGIHRGHIVVHPPAVAAFEIPWHGETRLTLPHGTLEFAAGSGTGPVRAALPGNGVTIRARAGGERIQLAKDQPPRALKRILQEAEMPFWLRNSLPLVFCGDALAAVPGIGVDATFQATAGIVGYEIRWRPAAL